MSLDWLFGSETKLPDSWALATLHELTEISPGVDTEGLADADQVHFVPMAAVSEDFRGINVDGFRPLRELRKGFTPFAAGDVLLAKITPCMENGKGGLVPPLSRKLAFGSTEFHVLRASVQGGGPFLALFLSQPAFRRLARANMTGSAGQMRVPAQWLRTVTMPVPPAAEQSRIVAKLEELLSDLDAGVAELKAAQKKLQQYRQSLLKAAVEGTLTSAWREAQRANGAPIETGEQLLARILRERRARWEEKQLAKFKEQGKPAPRDWQKKYPEPVAPDTTDLPELPEGWVWATLGQLLAELASGSRDWAPFYGRGECVFVMAQNVRPWRPDFSFKQLVDPPLNHRDRIRSEIRVDDLLVTIVGANTGQTCRVDQPVQSHFVCQSVALMRLVMPNMAEFVNIVLNSEGHGQRQFREMNYGAGRPHLSFEQLESVLVPLAPVSEQAMIIAALAQAMVACVQVERDMSLLVRQSAAQRQNILRAAFSGQLVPQDPNDEPASVLLERIRSERAAKVRQSKPRSRNTGKAAKAGKAT